MYIVLTNFVTNKNHGTIRTTFEMKTEARISEAYGARRLGEIELLVS